MAVHLIEEYLKDYSFKEAVRRVFLRLEGLNAIIILDAKNQKFYAVKNGSPLVLGFGVNANYLASDSASLLAHTKKVYFLDDGQLAEITAEKVTINQVADNKLVKFKNQRLDWRFEETQKGNYPHFMLKEICEQPRVLKKNLNKNSRQLSLLAKIIKKADNVFLVACGTGAYAALTGSYIFSKVAKKNISYAYGSEFGYTVDFLTNKSLVIALSQSGETIDIIESVVKARAKGAKIVAMVNVLGSTLYRMSDYKILLNAGPEKAVASTKAFTAKLSNLILLAYKYQLQVKQGERFIRLAIKETEKILDQKYIERIKKLADKIYKQTDIYSIGRGMSYPIALEAALKIKEISYIHAEGFAAGELKHGVIALIEKGTPCLVFLPNDETYGATLAGAMEIKSRGGYIIGISHKPHEIFDCYFPIGDCGIASCIPNIVVAQLLAYHLSVMRGIDPDKPRNLAKSVTVK